MDKITALKRFLSEENSEVLKEDIEESSYDDSIFEWGHEEYLVLTEEEADERVRENIKETAWAFNADFLANYTGLDIKVFQGLQELCEGSNEAILSLIGDLKPFVEEAVMGDGIGHFLSSYDGEENESGEFLIYRIN